MELPKIWRPRVAICGIHIESSTFTPQLSYEHDFTVLRKEAMLQRYSWIEETWSQAIDWLPVFHARALPGGVIDRPVYDAWKAEIVSEVSKLHRAAALDGLFFDVHGAMSVTGLLDAEGDLITALREVIGPDVLVSLSTDLHGNMSETLFHACDLLTTYRMAPHEDALESRRRAMYNLAMRLLSNQGKPAKSLVHIPILLPGEKTSTRIEPAKRLYARIPYLESLPGVLDAAFWIGFAWADQPRCKAAVVITGDLPADQLSQLALGWAQEIWEARDEFEFVAPVDTMENCLCWAETAQRPTFISDSGDNPGAGGANDVTYALHHLLQWEPTMSGKLHTICVSLHDRQAIELAEEVGVGQIANFTVGGKIDPRWPGPVSFPAKVTQLAEDSLGGTSAVLRVFRPVHEELVETGLDVVVTEKRNQFGDLEKFTTLGLDPQTADLIVVKIGYLEPDLYNLHRDWKMALTPGGVDQDLLRLGHTMIDRPMVPFDTNRAVLDAVELLPITVAPAASAH
ncbi:M81 family metallopeptidase [Gleimia sp. 6138-11-ORH1]|uniref:M81 family metallopeptidase n=1 Tax=Gleimia sp. 6138-11-ORH1 TaxID=2973937 RepID=UPI0021697F8B|nr:M81 family metallopeptidase [Gleimia sp. 6138-11-ORH1]MCS4484301.1 M81 family metallopeptidase [Gleimia sp. 6138-11-ORH1]